jgi:hypothetical protein
MSSSLGMSSDLPSYRARAEPLHRFPTHKFRGSPLGSRNCAALNQLSEPGQCGEDALDNRADRDRWFHCTTFRIEKAGILSAELPS